MSEEKHPVRGWLRLIRLAHLFSAPGDAAMGFLLICGAAKEPVPCGRLAFLAASVLFSCLAGGIVNDLVDLKSDCMERPNRPLPSQEVPIRAAVIAAIASAVLALCFSAHTPNTFLLCAA